MEKLPSFQHQVPKQKCLRFGRPTGSFLGVRFPFLGTAPHPYSHLYLHPTQLYEAGLDLANFAVLFVLWRRRHFPGQVASLYLIMYGLIRFILEYWRMDGGRGYLIRGHSALSSLSLPQAISIILIILGPFLNHNRKKTVKP